MNKCVLDLKSGKAEPWAKIQTAAYTLLDTPVDFEAEGHIYYCPEVIARLYSVTEILTAEGFIDKTWYDEWSRTRGEYVHLACHLDDIGELDESTVDETIMPYLEAWRKFKRESGFVVEQSEKPMANLHYMYAGTPDCIGHFPTGVIKRMALELHKDGTYKPDYHTDQNDVNIWKATLAVYFWKLNNLKRKE